MKHYQHNVENSKKVEIVQQRGESLKGSKLIKTKHLQVTDSGKSQNLEASLKVQSGLKTGRLLSS